MSGVVLSLFQLEARVVFIFWGGARAREKEEDLCRRQSLRRHGGAGGAAPAAARPRSGGAGPRRAAGWTDRVPRQTVLAPPAKGRGAGPAAFWPEEVLCSVCTGETRGLGLRRCCSARARPRAAPRADGRSVLPRAGVQRVASPERAGRGVLLLPPMGAPRFCFCCSFARAAGRWGVGEIRGGGGRGAGAALLRQAARGGHSRERGACERVGGGGEKSVRWGKRSPWEEGETRREGGKRTKRRGSGWGRRKEGGAGRGEGAPFFPRERVETKKDKKQLRPKQSATVSRCGARSSA